MKLIHQVRRLLPYGALTAAAIASIATSQLTWALPATLPTRVSPGPGEAFRFDVETTDAPSLSFSIDGVRPEGEKPRFFAGDGGLRGNDGGLAIWVQPGQTLRAVSIAGTCDDGCGSGPCAAPEGAYVRVLGPTSVPIWTASDSRAVDFTKGGLCEADLAVTVDLAPSDLDVLYSAEPEIESDRSHVRVAYATVRTAPTDPSHVSLRWSCTELRSTRFQLVATAHGICDKAPCEAPTTTRVKIGSIAPWRK